MPVKPRGESSISPEKGKLCKGVPVKFIFHLPQSEADSHLKHCDLREGASRPGPSPPPRPTLALLCTWPLHCSHSPDPRRRRGWGHHAERCCSCRHLLSLHLCPFSSFLSAAALGPDGHQSQRGPADLFPGSLSPPSPAEEG